MQDRQISLYMVAGIFLHSMEWRCVDILRRDFPHQNQGFGDLLDDGCSMDGTGIPKPLIKSRYCANILQFAVARATPSMVSNMRGGFFLFFAACMTIMFVCVYLFVPETKGITLESMDEVFGSAYVGRDRAIDVELGRDQQEVQGNNECWVMQQI
jgi:hypothetical protein